MWRTIIIAIIAWNLFRFFSDFSKQKEKMEKIGGVKKKYSTLINTILSGDSKCRIIQETSTFIRIGVSGISGSTLFDITQTFGTVTIQYKVDSTVFGKNKLEWVFDENMNQVTMLEKINADIEELTLKIISKFS